MKVGCSSDQSVMHDLRQHISMRLEEDVRFVRFVKGVK
jgi:hypothetical protein